MEYITICNLVMDCDKKLLKGGLTNPVACGLRQTVAENRWRGAGSLRACGCLRLSLFPVLSGVCFLAPVLVSLTDTSWFLGSKFSILLLELT